MSLGENGNTVIVQLTPETREALYRLDADVQALSELVAMLKEEHTHLIGLLERSVVAEHMSANGAALFGDEELAVAPPPAVELPPEMAGRTVFSNTVRDEMRIRDVAYTRVPRSKQLAVLRELMADGEWYASVTLARHLAGDDEEYFRYLKSALGGRLRDMLEVGQVERRKSHVVGSAFEHRLVEGA